MDNIVRLTPTVILALAEVLTVAYLDGRSVRIMTGTDGEGRNFVKWDSGVGWTPPFYSEDVFSGGNQ